MAATATKEVTATVEDGYLVVRVPLNDTPTRSASGKTLVVASTRGNKVTDVQIKGKNVVVGVNAYIKD